MNKWWIADKADNPLAYNETAAVSFLCSAAGATGMLGLAEYSAEKSNTERGRCDLWLASQDSRHEWVFEFKYFNSPGVIGARLKSMLDSAVSCAKYHPKNLNRVAGIITTTYYTDTKGLSAEKRRAKIRDVKNRSKASHTAFIEANHISLAWHFANPDDDGSDAFIMLRML